MADTLEHGQSSLLLASPLNGSKDDSSCSIRCRFLNSETLDRTIPKFFNLPNISFVSHATSSLNSHQATLPCTTDATHGLRSPCNVLRQKSKSTGVGGRTKTIEQRCC